MQHQVYVFHPAIGRTFTAAGAADDRGIASNRLRRARGTTGRRGRVAERGIPRTAGTRCCHGRFRFQGLGWWGSLTAARERNTDARRLALKKDEKGC